MGISYYAVVMYGVRKLRDESKGDIEDIYPELDVVSLGYDTDHEYIVGKEVVSVDDPDTPEKLQTLTLGAEKEIDARLEEKGSYLVALQVD